ncbi:MAG TPA: transglutaminase domain-containing protein, partial [Bacteroidales bacterium]|nr:transglutaminase domain-containing protein [Bacteroidales bacterium]
MKIWLTALVAFLTLISCNNNGKTPTPKEVAVGNWEVERMRRIALDFNKTEKEALAYIHRYFPDVTAEQLKKWEESRALESRLINGEKRYFSRAFRNLFRIDSTCRAKYEEINGPEEDPKAPLLQEHLPRVVELTKKSGVNKVEPVTYSITYTLTVPANTVPEREVIRAWMPLPRTDVPRQKDFRLTEVSEPDYIISPDRYVHKSIYMEKEAVKDSSTVFSYSFTYTAFAQYDHFDPLEDIRPYDTLSEEYRKYTQAVPPHIVTDGKVAELARKIVGDETNPYLKLQKIFSYISRNYPWAGAREYSTIESIPLYVLENGHGDCGQVSLLFISMCRSLGIPARWESGWMLHPGAVNLHDWAEAYLEGVGWIPVDQSFGLQRPLVELFYSRGIDAYRMAVNSDIGGAFFPAKIHFRSETVDFQRGEVEW